MITLEQLRAVSHEALADYAADLHTILEHLVAQNQDLLELVALLQADGKEDSGPHALH